MTIPLVDKSGQIFEAPDDDTANRQIQAFGVRRAEPDEVARYDANQRQSGLGGQVLSFGSAIAATAAQGATTLDQAIASQGPENAQAPATAEQVAPFAFSPEAKEARSVNPTAALAGSAVPDIALTALAPGEGIGGLLARSAISGAVTEAGASALADKKFEVGDALLYGAGAGVFEGGLHYLGGAVKALGGAGFNAIDNAVERAQGMARNAATAEADPVRRAAMLAENAPELIETHQAALNEALGAIDERMASSTDKTFADGALRRTVSDNFDAQSSHFLDLATQVFQAAEVTDAPGVKAASDTLRDAIESNGPKMFAAVREASAQLTEFGSDNPLVREAADALDASMRNEGVWGRAAKNYSTLADQLNATPPRSSFDISDLKQRGDLQQRLDQARAVATATGDKKLARAVADAAKTLGDADEVMGAHVMAPSLGEQAAERRRTVDRLRGEGHVPPMTEEPPKGIFGRVKHFGDNLAEYELDNLVQTGLKAGAATIGHTLGGIPGAATGYLLGRYMHIRYGDQITRFIWKAAKGAVLREAEKAPLRTAAAMAGAGIGGSLAGIPGAVGGAALGNRLAGQVAEKAATQATKAKNLGQSWAQRIWGTAKQAAKDNPGKLGGVALLGASGALQSQQDPNQSEGAASPLAASAGLLAMFLVPGGRAGLEQELEQTLAKLTARQRMTLRMVTEHAAGPNEVLLRKFAAGGFSHIPTASPELIMQAQVENLAHAYAHAHPGTEFATAGEAYAHMGPDMQHALAMDAFIRNAKTIESDPAMRRLAENRRFDVVEGGKATGEPESKSLVAQAVDAVKKNPGTLAGTALLGAAGALQSQQNPNDPQGLGAPAAASAGLLAFFLAAGGRRALQESLGEALAGLTSRERMSLRMATERAAAPNEELLRQFANGHLAHWTPEEVLQEQYNNVARAYRASNPGISQETDAIWGHAGQALVDAAQADQYYRNAAIIENDPELLRLAEVRRFDVIHGEGGPVQGAPDLRRFGIPEPGRTRIVPEGSSAAAPDVTGGGATDLRSAGVAAEGLPPDLAPFAPNTGRSQAQRANEAVAALPDVTRRANMQNAEAHTIGWRNAELRHFIGGGTSLTPEDVIARQTERLLEEYRQLEGIADDSIAFTHDERAAAHELVMHRNAIAVRDIESARAAAAPEARAVAERMERARGGGTAERGEQLPMPFARGDAAEAASNSLAEHNARTVEHNEALDDLETADFTGSTWTDLEHARDRAINELRPGMTDGQRREINQAALAHWTEQYANQYGGAPNARELRYAEAAIDDATGSAWSYRERVNEGLNRTRPSNEMLPPSLRPEQQFRGYPEGGDLDEASQAVVRQRIEETRRMEGDIPMERVTPEMVQTYSRIHGGHFTPDEEVFLHEELGAEAPAESDLEQRINEALSERALEDEGFEEYDRGPPMIDFDDLVRHIEDQGDTLTPWEHHHLRQEFEENQGYYERRLEEYVDENRTERREEYERENPPDSEESPDSEEPDSSRRNPHERDPDVDDGLPAQWALEREGMTRVTMRDPDGIRNVFGTELSLQDAKNLFGLQQLREYAERSGKEMEATLTVNSDEIVFGGKVGGFSIGTEYTPGENGGVKVYQLGLFLPAELQGKGIAKAMIRPAFETLEKLGATEVHAQAAEIGKYAWPALGFRPSEHAEVLAVEAFEKQLHQYTYSGNAIGGAANELIGKIKNLRDLADAKINPTFLRSEILGEMHKRFDQAAQNAGHANVDWHADMFDRAGNYRIGKAFLLSTNGPWNSGLSLTIDRSDEWYKQFLARLGALSVAGLTSYEMLKAWHEAPLDFQTNTVSEGDREQSRQDLVEAQHAADKAARQSMTTAKLDYLKVQRAQLVTNTARSLVSPADPGRTVQTRVAGTTSSAGIAAFLGDNATLQEAFADKRASLQKLQRDPMMLVNALTESLNDLHDTDPQLHAQSVAQIYKIAQFLQSKMPATIGTSLVRPEGSPVNPLAVRQFALYYSAALDPSTVYADMASNRYSSEQIETLKAVWSPEFDNLKAQITQALADNRPTLAQRQRLDLHFDFGPALDAALSPRLLQAYAEYKQQGGKGDSGAPDGQPGPGNGQGGNKPAPGTHAKTEPSIGQAGALGKLALGTGASTPGSGPAPLV